MERPALLSALLERLGAEAAQLAWPDQPVAPGEHVSVLFAGEVGDVDFTAQIAVHRGQRLVRQRVYAGWDGISFMLRWVDNVIE